jgi:maltose O-acetyltransferase
VRQRGRAKPVEPAPPVASRRGLAWARRPLHRARQVVQVGRAWMLFGRPALLKRVYCGHGVRVSNAGTLRLADGLLFLGGMLPTDIVCRTGATLDIGTGGLFAYGTTLDAAASIVIGARCLVGQRVTIRDHDDEGARPITIGDDVWLAHGALVGPGVRIGHRVVVGAGSVVLRDVPDDHVALGNPAKAVPLGLLSRSG